MGEILTKKANKCIGLIDYISSGRIPAPTGSNQGSSCNEGIQNPTCQVCKTYYDAHMGSGYGNNDRGNCVWVPQETKCYAKGFAEENNWSFDEICSGRSKDTIMYTAILNLNDILKIIHF